MQETAANGGPYNAHRRKVKNLRVRIMDITDTLRQDIPKTDFFDFVPTSESSDHSAQYQRNLKALGIFIEPAPTTQPNSNNNNGSEESKETNNNHLLMHNVDMASYVDNTFWSAADSNMLDELNCWPHQSSTGNLHGVKTDNTDGAIYTLTVLNGSDQQAAWFKQEIKEEKLVPPTALDLDSFLNIIPPNFPNTFQAQIKQDFGPFEANGFPENKERPQENNIVTEVVLTDSPGSFNNNNEWKRENNNEVDSLLRNALQGKSFVRYNGVKTEKDEPKKAEDDKIMTLDTPLLYENPTVIDSDNPSSAQSMDDIILSQLDVSYPEDYEKLKRIESEVAESVEQYCLDRTYAPAGPQMQVEPLLNVGAGSKSNKKYTKRSKSQITAPGSSTGVRKERSLHYCNICSKGFKDKYSVNVHIRTHTGEKPFTCSLCGKSFRQKAHLAKHYQTHMAQAKNGVASNQKASKNLIPTS